MYYNQKQYHMMYLGAISETKVYCCCHQCPCPVLASFATVIWSDIYFGPQVTFAVVSC